MEQKIDVTLTPREQHRLRDFAACRERIKKKIAGDPASVRVKGWNARLKMYADAETSIILAAQLDTLSPGRFLRHRGGTRITPPSAAMPTATTAKPPTKH